jgi:choline monooxygenase
MTQVRHYQAKFHPDPELSYTLPGYFYYDPAVFAKEKEEIFFKTWQLAGYLHDFKEPGDYLVRDLLDQQVLIVKGKDGRLRAFYNVCQHRGHELAKGRGRKLIFTCPYHAWSYDASGVLKAAPNADAVKNFDYDELGLVPVRVETLLNMVFVNLDPAAKPIDEVYAGLEAEIRGVMPEFDGLKLVRTDPYAFNANWKFIFDAMECYHCPVIHPMVMGENTYVELSFEITAHKHWALHFIRGNRDVISRKVEGSVTYDLRPDQKYLDTYIWWMWPNIYLVIHQGNPNFKVLYGMPKDEGSSWETVDNFFLKDPPDPVDVSNMNNFRDLVQPQDIPPMESQQRGVKSAGYTQGRLMVDGERTWRSEHGVHHFNKLCWEAVRGPHYEIEAGGKR